MRKQFNWILAIVLNYVTCGIYGLYMWYKMTAENNDIARKYGIDPIMGFIPQLFLGIITCGIYSIVWMFKFFALQVKIAKASGVQVSPSENTFLLVILSWIPFYSFYMLCDNYNRTVEKN